MFMEAETIHRRVESSVTLQNTLHRALLRVIHLPQYKDLIDNFYSVYRFRQSFPWLAESGSDSGRMTGLAYALSGALASYGFEIDVIQHLPTYVEHITIDNVFEEQYIRAVNEVVHDPESVADFVDALSVAGVRIDSLTIEELMDYLVLAMINYCNSALAGTSGDPW